jgi:hypothetical protein
MEGVPTLDAKEIVVILPIVPLNPNLKLHSMSHRVRQIRTGSQGSPGAGLHVKSPSIHQFFSVTRTIGIHHGAVDALEHLQLHVILIGAIVVQEGDGVVSALGNPVTTIIEWACVHELGEDLRDGVVSIHVSIRLQVGIGAKANSTKEVDEVGIQVVFNERSFSARGGHITRGGI